MRKIYALVLLAATLLVGTNAWAEGEIQVSTKDALRTNWYSAPSGSVIQLTGDILDMDSVLWLGTATATEDPRSLTLDLNGHILKGTKRHMFLLTHGELIIRNSGTDGKIWHTPADSEMKYVDKDNNTFTRYYGDAFVLCGSALQTVNAKDSGYFTHLVIEVGVVIDANDGVNAISLDVLENHVAGQTSSPYKHVSNSRFGSRPHVIEYHTNLFTTQTTYGVANGVCVDIKGTIMAYKYGIKTNGTVREQTYVVKDAVNTTRYNNEFSGFDMSINNTYSPYIHLHSTGRIKVTDTGLTGTGNKQALAVYASGYARWLLEGYCGGNVGVYAKSGDIDIVNATIESTNPNSANTTGQKSGSTTQGCAIVIESTEVQSGQIVVDIEGSEVSAQSGYAIEETVTKPAEEGSYTSSVTVDESTIVGGNEGAIAVATKDGAGNYVTTVYSGTVAGNVVDEEDSSTSLVDVLPKTEDTHTTIVTDPQGGNPVVVINPGKANSKWFATIQDALTAGMDSVKLTGSSDVMLENFTLAELEINKMDSTTNPSKPVPVNQTLTIGDETHFVVAKIGKVILGSNAKIIVKAGSQLLITGADGIFSRYASNLVLEANADKQATFVIGPNVIANRQPYATVDLGTKAKQVSESNYLWQRFAPPVLVTSSFTKSESVTTYLNVIDVVSESWVGVTNLNQLKVFTPAALTNKSAMGGVVYTFTGRLVGNVVDSVKLISTKWNYFGNSYIAPMSIRDLTDTLKTQGVDATIYMWNTKDQVYDQINEAAYIMALLENKPIADSIPAMEFFVVLNRSRKAGVMDINYKKSIYNYAVNPTNYRSTAFAPARMNANLSTLRINVESLNGEKDNVVVLEGNNYSADYENGLDAEKLMNQGMNLFVADEQNLSILASDDVIGTQLTLQTVEDVNYTFTFSGVRGEHYALRDNHTGRVVEMVEGGQYTFSAQPNETIEGRFEIVGRQEMPTAVETIETENAAKAVYTILGQYVGDASNWDALPAGIYVVDGVKIVK